MECIDIKYTDSVCELRNRRGKLLATGIVAQIGKTFIKINNTADIVSDAAKGMHVYMNIINTELGISIASGIVYIATPMFVIVEKIKREEPGERRSFYRLTVEMPTVLLHDSQRHNITVVNISLGGLMFTGPGGLQCGDKVMIELELLKERIVFTCVVKRAVSSKQQLYRYGCEFCENGEKKTEQLCQYMFRMEGQRVR